MNYSAIPLYSYYTIKHPTISLPHYLAIPLLNQPGNPVSLHATPRTRLPGSRI